MIYGGAYVEQAVFQFFVDYGPNLQFRFDSAATEAAVVGKSNIRIDGYNGFVANYHNPALMYSETLVVYLPDIGDGLNQFVLTIRYTDSSKSLFADQMVSSIRISSTTVKQFGNLCPLPNKRLKLTEPPAVQSGLVRGDGKNVSQI